MYTAQYQGETYCAFVLFCSFIQSEKCPARFTGREAECVVVFAVSVRILRQ